MICPTTPGDIAIISFTLFDLEDGYDFMTIYNNDSATGVPTVYTGTSSPGIVSSTNATGCLTVVFESNGSVVNQGWDAIITCCTVDAGTFTTTPINSSNITLCIGDSWSVNSNDDYILPTPVVGETAEVMYAICNCDPTASLNPLEDDCYAGLLWSGDSYSTNSVGATNSNAGGGIPNIFTGIGVTGTGNTIWFLPITADDSDNAGNPNGVINIDNNDDGCYAAGTPIAITYLEIIAFSEVAVCNTGTGTTTVTITGGMAGYTLLNTGAGTLSTTSVANDGGTVAITGLVDSDNYSFDLTDANGCTASFSGIYADITAPTAVCQNITVSLDPVTYSVTITEADIHNGSSDNCSIILSLSNDTFGCSDIGDNTITLTVTDPSGNSNTCDATVTVNGFAIGFAR